MHQTRPPERVHCLLGAVRQDHSMKTDKQHASGVYQPSGFARCNLLTFSSGGSEGLCDRWMPLRALTTD